MGYSTLSRPVPAFSNKNPASDRANTVRLPLQNYLPFVVTTFFNVTMKYTDLHAIPNEFISAK